MNELERARLHYAEEVRLSGGVESASVVAAFAAVPRERFLGPGPWHIPWPPRRHGESWSYRATADADPRHVCHNVLVAIDRDRELHNGLPSFLAFKIDAAAIQPADRIVHVGCGVGYYTAILAELVPQGRVIGIEVDAELAKRSRENLAPWTNAEVVCGDGTRFDPGPTDVFFVNAGVTHPAAIWLERLAPRGRMILPLTYRDATSNTRGIVLLVTHSRALEARTISGISVFDCTAVRDPDDNLRLARALERDDSAEIRSLRALDHPTGETCWVHVGTVCVSKLPVDD